MSITNSIKLFTFSTAFLSLTAVLHAGDSDQLVASFLMQDEPRRLPADNTAVFASAAREVSIQLDTLADIGQEDLAGTLVTVVDSEGGTEEYRADENGTVTIEDASEGPHAIVASNESSHGAIVLNFQEVDDVQDAVVAAHMPVLSIGASELLSVVDRYLDTSVSSDPIGAPEMTAPTGSAFGYSVRLGEDGVLDGQVLSIFGTASVSDFSGTRIAIYQSGALVSATYAEAGGQFQFEGMQPGVYGLIAAGPAGYAAFAFTVLESDAFAADKLPVVLIPQTMVPSVISAVRRFYSSLLGTPSAGVGGVGALGGLAGLAPAASAAGNVGSSGGAGGAASGLGGLGAVIPFAAAAAIANDSSSPGIIASPSGS